MDAAKEVDQIPCVVGLRLSSTSCSISGKPPFDVIATYTCITSRPIWVLVSLFTYFANRVIVHDPNHPRGKTPEGQDRPRGCYPQMQDEWDKESVEFEDSALVRLNPGEKFEMKYTLYTVPDMVRRSDVWFMKLGNPYWVELGKRKCWWMYVDEMQEGLSEQEMKEALRFKDCVEWKSDCRAEFTAVE